MEVTMMELERLNFYRASELHGGLVLGQLVRRVREPWLMQQLTQHSAEEVRHAQVWTEAILEVGGRPRPVRWTYQAHYAAVLGAPASVFQIMALTQVFEQRVYRHFLERARVPGTHAAVRRTLALMIEEEKGHLSWVKQWLDAEATRRGAEMRALLRRYRRVDEQIYRRLMVQYELRTNVPAVA